MDVLDLMAWVQDECRRRGCDDPTAQMRKMHDARRKHGTGISVADVQRDTVEELKIAGFYLEGERTIEQVIAEQEALNPTKVQMWKSSEPGGGTT